MTKNVSIAMFSSFDFIISLSRIANNNNKNDFLKKLEIDFLEKFKPDENIAKWIRISKKKFNKQRLEELDIFHNKQTQLASICFYYMANYSLDNFQKLYEFIENKDFLEVIANHIERYSQRCKLLPSITTEKFLCHVKENTVLEYLEKTNLSSDRKWQILQILLKPDFYKSKLLSFWKWYYQNIYVNHSEKIDKHVSRSANDLRRKIDTYENEYLTILINTSFEGCKREIVISLSYFAEVGHYVVHLDDDNRDHYIIGFRHMEFFVERKHGLLSNVHLFKSLGDETRQNILRILQNEEWYGERIAGELNISNSTVSYHLHILFLAGLVSIRRVNTKSYFRLNKANLKRYLEDAYDIITSTTD